MEQPGDGEGEGAGGGAGTEWHENALFLLVLAVAPAEFKLNSIVQKSTVLTPLFSRSSPPAQGLAYIRHPLKRQGGCLQILAKAAAAAAKNGPMRGFRRF